MLNMPQYEQKIYANPEVKDSTSRMNKKGTRGKEEAPQETYINNWSSFQSGPE